MKTLLTILFFAFSTPAYAAVPYWQAPMASTFTAYGTGYLSGLLKVYPSTATLSAAPSIMLDGVNRQLTVRNGVNVTTMSATGFYGDGSTLTGVATSAQLTSTAAALSTEISRATLRENDIAVSTGTLEAFKVNRAGDVMSGPLQTSSLTVTGNAQVNGNSFSVGGSTLVARAGNIEIGGLSANQYGIARLIIDGPVGGGTANATSKSSIFTSNGNSDGPNTDFGWEMAQYTGGTTEGYGMKMYGKSSGNVTYGIATRRQSLTWTERLVIDSLNGNVGVGTITPDQRFTVAGNISNTGQIISSGTGTNYLLGSLSLGANPPTGNLVNIGDSQNNGVGVLVTNPSAGAAAYSVYGISAYENNIVLYAFGAGYATSGAYMADGLTIEAQSSASAGINVLTVANAPIRFYTNGATNERMRIGNDGNIGIGTAQPFSKLTVSSGIITVDGSGAGIVTTGDVTAVAFHGSGAGLTGLPGGGDVVLAATQTFTGANTFTSSVTFPTRDRIFFGNELANSSSTILNAYSTANNQTSTVECVSNSSVAITTAGDNSHVFVAFTGVGSNDSTGYSVFSNYWVNGSSSTVSAGGSAYSANKNTNLSFTHITGTYSKGTLLKFCISLTVDAGIGTIDAVRHPTFSVMELR